MMKTYFRQNQQGFSLIEAIVVSVLMAILAAIAIPNYIGYVNDQRQTSVDNLWETAAAAANSEFRRTGTLANDADVDKNEAPLNLYFDDTKYTVAISGSTLTVTQTGTSYSKSATYR